jgi:hypothetical protein
VPTTFLPLALGGSHRTSFFGLGPLREKCFCTIFLKNGLPNFCYFTFDDKTATFFLENMEMSGVKQGVGARQLSSKNSSKGDFISRAQYESLFLRFLQVFVMIQGGRGV